MVIIIKLTVNKQEFEVSVIDGVVSYTFVSDGSPNIIIHGLEGEGDSIISELQVEEGSTSTSFEKTYANMISRDIVDFSLSNPNGRKYIGQYSDNDSTPSSDPNKYIWRISQGEQGVSVSSTNTFFYLSISKTSLEGGSWVEERPTWEDGKYTWMKIKTIYSDGTSNESEPVNLTGATGRAVEDISTEYYLSTSRDVWEGGSWGPEPYSWEKEKYMWTRSKIVWSNPSDTTYTTPMLDSSWEAVNKIEIGGRNLLRNSGEKVSNGTYNIARYDLTDGIKAGEEVTLTIWGSLATTKTNFRAYNSGGSVQVASLTDNGDGTYSSTFKWAIGSSDNTYLNVYAFTNAQTGTSTINKIKLERGNIATDWTEAPEDTQAKLDEKADTSDTEARLNEISSELLVKQQEIEAAATAGELDAFVKKYNQEQEAYAKEKKASEEALASAEDAIDLITNKMDNMAETWEFFDEYIKFDKGSIILGNETEGSHVRIHNDRISFYSNGYEVASITQGKMTIEAGTFVEEIQISEFKFQKSSNGHLTVRYVG